MSTSTNDKIDTIAATLGWDDYQTTGSLKAGPNGTMSVNDGDCCYLVDLDQAHDWAEGYVDIRDDDDRTSTSYAYESFCDNVAMV